jgi:hypothetical protein
MQKSKILNRIKWVSITLVFLLLLVGLYFYFSIFSYRVSTTYKSTYNNCLIEESVSYYKGGIRVEIINIENKRIHYKFDTGLHYYNGECIKDVKWCSNSVFILYHSIEWGDFIHEYSLNEVKSESIFIDWKDVQCDTKSKVVCDDTIITRSVNRRTN